MHPMYLHSLPPKNPCQVAGTDGRLDRQEFTTMLTSMFKLAQQNQAGNEGPLAAA